MPMRLKITRVSGVAEVAKPAIIEAEKPAGNGLHRHAGNFAHSRSDSGKYRQAAYARRSYCQQKAFVFNTKKYKMPHLRRSIEESASRRAKRP